MTRSFQIRFHGSFEENSGSGPVRRLDLEPIPFKGFYTSRLIDSPSLEAAVARGKELIRHELEKTLLHNRVDIFVSLEAEEWKEVDGDLGPKNKEGFTFY